MHNILRKIRNGFLRLRLKKKPMESVFTYIYANNSWGHHETLSGHGSSKDKTENLRRLFPELLDRYGIRSIFDVPCGDLNWLKMIDLGDIEYIGADIVAGLVKSNKKLFSHSGKKFTHFNAIDDIPPKVDLIFCRDLFIHLPLEECGAVLRGFAKSSSTYVLVTTYIYQKENANIKPGAWRPVNLQKPPFNLPKPIELIDDGDSDPSLQDYGKCMGLPPFSVC